MSDLLKKARARMMLSQPFFATLLVSHDMVVTTDVPTMGTDMTRIYVNPDFVEELGTVPKVMFVLAHEVMHMALEHGMRLNGRNPILWNIACDFAINLILVDAGLEYPGNGCLDAKYNGMSADQIYEQLMKQVDKAQKQGKSGKPGDPGSGVPGLDSMHGPDGDLMDPQMTPAQQAEAERKMRQKVAQAAQMARMAGKMSAGLDRLVGEILDPQVPWQVLLRDFVTRITKDDETWGRRNRRFHGVYLPSRYSERMGEVVMIADTSGSISEDEIRKYCGEAHEIVETMNPEQLRIVYCDSKVCGEQVFDEGEFHPSKVKPKGGGGTDMRVALNHIEQFDPEFAILFTDGYTPWPQYETPYPLFVCCTTDTDCPVGNVIRIK